MNRFLRLSGIDARFLLFVIVNAFTAFLAMVLQFGVEVLGEDQANLLSLPIFLAFGFLVATMLLPLLLISLLVMVTPMTIVWGVLLGLAERRSWARDWIAILAGLLVSLLGAMGFYLLGGWMMGEGHFEWQGIHAQAMMAYGGATLLVPFVLALIYGDTLCETV